MQVDVVEGRRKEEGVDDIAQELLNGEDAGERETTNGSNGAQGDVKKKKKQMSNADVEDGDEQENGEEEESGCKEATEETKIDALAQKKAKKKKKRSNMSKNKKDRLAFERMCNEVLEATKVLVEGIPDEKLVGPPEKFIGYDFSGPLRPCYVTNQVQVPAGIEKPDYADEGIPRSELAAGRDTKIPVYTSEEIEKMREVCRIGREVLDIAGKFLKAGVTGDEIDRIVHHAIVSRGAYPSPLNYNHFPKSLCVSVNEVICHGIPDCRKIREGDIVNLDVSVYKDGFHSDLNETYLIGKVDEDSKRLVRTAYECLMNAAKLIKPGTMYRDIGPVISKVAAQNGCSVVRSYCGHGVGRLFHTVPNVPHYAKNKATGIMRPGHVFTIEPMINDGPSWRDRLWPDNWTVVTLDGRRSAQFEHTFLVTDDGVEILTARPGTSTAEMTWDEAAIQR